MLQSVDELNHYDIFGRDECDKFSDNNILAKSLVDV